METITRAIAPEEEGLTVRRYLRSRLGFSARAVSRAAFADTGILVNGQRAFTDRVLRAGDIMIVEIGDRKKPKKAVVPGNWPLPIVWEDEYLLIADKPAGMTAHASNFSPEAPTVAGALAWSRGTDFLFHPVNRLDKGTTGLMVVAKSGYVHDLLRRALHSPRFRREYRGICLGTPDPPIGVIDAPIGRDESSAIARQVRPDGAPALTRYAVLASGGGLSLLRLLPQTGRTHQLRLHMTWKGCPLAGDWLYGREDPDLIARPALHSCALRMVHPVTKEEVRVDSSLPEDMERLLRRIGTGDSPQV